MRKRMPKKLFSCCACCGGGATHRHPPDEDSDDEMEARQATASYAPLPRPPASSTSTTSSTRPSTATDTDRSRAAAERGSTPSIASVTERASAAFLGATSRRSHAPAGGLPYDCSSERRGHSERLWNATASPPASSVSRSRQSIAQLFLQPHSVAAFSTPTRPRRLPAISPQLSPARVPTRAKLWNEKDNADGLASTSSPVASSASATSHRRALLNRPSPTAAPSAPSRSSLASLPSRSTSLSQSQASIGHGDEHVDVEVEKPVFSLLAAHRLRHARPNTRPYIHVRRSRRRSCAHPAFVGPATDADSDIDADPSLACVQV